MITDFNIFKKLNEQLGTASNFTAEDAAMVATKFPDARLENGMITYTSNGIEYALIKGHDIIELLKKDETGNYHEADENFLDIQQFVDTIIIDNGDISKDKINEKQTNKNMITTINEFKKYIKTINEGRGNYIVKYDGVYYPTYYINYYSVEDDEDDEETINDMFVDDVVDNIIFSDFAKELNLIKLDKPKYIDNDSAIYFENDIMNVVFADNETSMAVGTIPKFTQNDEYEEEYNKEEFEKHSNIFFNGLLSMYNLYRATSAWTQTKVTSIN